MPMLVEIVKVIDSVLAPAHLIEREQLLLRLRDLVEARLTEVKVAISEGRSLK